MNKKTDEPVNVLLYENNVAIHGQIQQIHTGRQTDRLIDQRKYTDTQRQRQLNKLTISNFRQRKLNKLTISNYRQRKLNKLTTCLGGIERVPVFGHPRVLFRDDLGVDGPTGKFLPPDCVVQIADGEVRVVS